MSSKQDLADRVTRAASWISAASKLPRSQKHEAFIFFYIALNAMYGRRQYEGTKTEAREDRKRFIARLLRIGELDARSGGSILPAALTASLGQAKTLIADQFLTDDYFRGAPLQKVRADCRLDLRRALDAWSHRDPRGLLDLLLHRLTVLRNRVMHGCVTYGAASKGLPSVVVGLAVIRVLVPAFHRLMRQYGHHVVWDPIPYPRLGSPGHRRG